MWHGTDGSRGDMLAVIAAHPQLAAVLDAHGLTFDPGAREVAELAAYNAVMSKRGQQVARNLAKLEAQRQAAHPGQEPGPVLSAQLQAEAWDHGRPDKKPSQLGHEAARPLGLNDADYRLNPQRVPVQPAASLDELSVQQIASRALDRCAAGASTRTVHDIAEHVTHLTNTHFAVETELRDLLATQDTGDVPAAPHVARPARARPPCSAPRSKPPPRRAGQPGS